MGNGKKLTLFFFDELKKTFARHQKLTKLLARKYNKNLKGRGVQKEEKKEESKTLAPPRPPRSGGTSRKSADADLRHTLIRRASANTFMEIDTVLQRPASDATKVPFPPSLPFFSLLPLPPLLTSLSSPPLSLSPLAL